ncbi:MAG: S-adenosylhomocysteine deaminase [Actinomycetia bacterium]|nr:S-adenosylhomocysteine deaminase [Actinomycetes bacterium]
MTPEPIAPVDLLVSGADHLVLSPGDELPGGWVGIRDGFVVAVGSSVDEAPPAARVLRADGCLVTPGLINTHHHMYQNLARAFAPVAAVPFDVWLATLTPLWSQLDEEAVHSSAWVGLAELALGGCTTTTDHLYIHPPGGGDLLGAEIAAAVDVGLRFHPTYGSMDITESDGGFAPDALSRDADDILATAATHIARHHDPTPGAMVRVALAPAATYLASEALLTGSAELAEQTDVRLHTHLAYADIEDDYCSVNYGRSVLDHVEACGWGSDRAWIAHGTRIDEAGAKRLQSWGTSVAHCPSSTMLAGGGMTPVHLLRDHHVPIGLGCDGSASTDTASLWLEARQALLVHRWLGGPDRFTARDALTLATLGGASCLGREGELGTLHPGAAADLVCWQLAGPAFSGALSDPVEAWLRCGPIGAHHTVVAGRMVVESGQLVHGDLDDRLAEHRRIATRFQSN